MLKTPLSVFSDKYVLIQPSGLTPGSFSWISGLEPFVVFCSSGKFWPLMAEEWILSSMEYEVWGKVMRTLYDLSGLVGGELINVSAGGWKKFSSSSVGALWKRLLESLVREWLITVDYSFMFLCEESVCMNEFVSRPFYTNEAPTTTQPIKKSAISQ